MISAINFSVYYQLKVCMQVTWERYLSLCNLLSVSLFWWKIADGVGCVCLCLCSWYAFSALTLLVGRQEGRPACENFEWWGTGAVICLERDTDLHMAQLMPLPLTVSCFSEIQIGFTFLVPAGTWVVPEKGPLSGCVCVCMLCSWCWWRFICPCEEKDFCTSY